MKVARVESFRVAPRWTFVRVETEDGLAGWGECILARRWRAVAGAVEDLAENLVGADAGRIEDVRQRLYAGGFFRGGPVLMTALAGIEIALWDLKGKRAGLPVHVLLGGPVRDRVRAYAWIAGDRPAGVAEGLRQRLAQGYTAVKMNATAEMHYLETPGRVREVAERAAIVRELAGEDFGLALDFHGRVHLPMARRLLEALAPYRPMWVEEPLLEEHNDLLPGLAAQTTIPLATGERLYDRWQFRPLLEGRAAAVVQPDVSMTGISELLTVGRMAAAYDVAVAPHCPNGPLSLAASLQAGACLPNVVIQEHSLGMHYNTGYEGLEAGEAATYLVDPAPLELVDGFLVPPSGPGLGVEVDEKRVRAADSEWRLRDPDWRNPDGTPAEW